MTTFNEGNHPRGEDGKFGPKYHRPVDADLEMSEMEAPPEDEPEYLHDDTEITTSKRTVTVAELDEFLRTLDPDSAITLDEVEHFYNTGADPIITRYDSGQIKDRTFTDLYGKPHNGPGGEPAITTYFPSGRINQIQFETHGQIADGPNGEPALQTWWPNGQKSMVYRYDDAGLANDGPSEEPAAQTWREDGSKETILRYRHGQLHDGPNGEPAVMKFWNNDHLQERLFFAHGEANNSVDGAPAVTQWHPNGHTDREVRLVGGKLHDGQDGEPALKRHHPNGRLAYTGRYDMGEPIKVGPNGEPPIRMWNAQGIEVSEPPTTPPEGV